MLRSLSAASSAVAQSGTRHIFSRGLHSTQASLGSSRGSGLPLAHTLVDVSAAAAEEIAGARYRVFGDVTGNGKRSGRKWLRRRLRGPAARGWYGVEFKDMLPEMITPTKEHVLRFEQGLNRVGKTRITGKIKNPLKSLVETLRFEDAMEDVRALGLRGRARCKGPRALPSPSTRPSAPAAC